MQSKAKTVDDYLAELPDDRREAIASVRTLVLENLPKGYQETMLWGMISYVVPLEVCPDTYNKLPLGYVSLASQKNYTTLYLLGVYSNSEQETNLREGYARAGKKLDFGKSCLRFKSLDDFLPEVVGPIIASVPMRQHIKMAEAARKK